MDLWALMSKASALGSSASGMQQAAKMYRDWLTSSSSVLKFAARFNLGVLLTDQEDLSGAEQAYRTIISEENPKFIQAYLNLGNVLERQNRTDEALRVYENSLQFVSTEGVESREFNCLVLNNLGRLLEIKKEYARAESYLKQSLTLDPTQKGAIQHWVHLRQKQCRWPVYEAFGEVGTDKQVNCTSMLAILAATDDPEQQLKNAKSYVEEKVRKSTFYLSGKEGYRHQKIRIGYLSGDLCSHAVGILTAEMYGLHDRSRFEVFAFCWSNEDGSQIRQRIKDGVDQLVRIADMDDEQAARHIRDFEIDVLIDLHGLTAGTRHNILTYRPAPIQVTYLGLPATTGLHEIDYVIADEYVLPESAQQFFTEKPLYVQPCFQVNDRQRQIGVPVSRTKYGLPEDKFVFCSFNNTYKITEEMFATWLRIISRVENSVLWIMADNPWATENLTQVAISANVDPARLFFTERVLPAEYLARYQCADLFLDAFPFNGGTTASDSLWAGLPVLTLSGRSFASRYAGSLLRGIGLESLITHTAEEYEQLAVEIASTPGRSDWYKETLQKHRDHSDLFDTPRFVKKLDSAIEELVRTREQECSQPLEADSVGDQQNTVSSTENGQQQAATVNTSAESVYVVLLEPDLDELAKKVSHPAAIELVYFDPALEDKLLSLGFVNSRFYDVSEIGKYSDVYKQASQSALQAGELMYSAIREICLIPDGFNWYYETLLYSYMYSNWYRLLGRYLVEHYVEIFGQQKPLFLMYDNPGYMYFHSFIPAISVVEVLAGSDCQFDVFNYAQGESPANGVVDVVPDLFSRPKIQPCALLFHLPTVMYDKDLLEQFIQCFKPEEVLGISPHYWDQSIGGDLAVPLVLTNSVIPVLPAEFRENVIKLCEQIRQSAETILQNLIATPFIRERQVKFFVDFARSQFILFFALEAYFSASKPKKILMADHDTGFHGPLMSFARRHEIPVTTFPHAKVSFHFPYVARDVRCLAHPVQGAGLLSMEAGTLAETRTSFPEVLTFDTDARRKIRTVGIVLNAISGHGVLLRSLDEYMSSLKVLVELLRAHGVNIKLRARPGQTLYRRIEEKTGISIQEQSYGSLGSIMDWGQDVDLCVMYDTPTSGQIDFLKRSIPIVDLMLPDWAEWEYNTANKEIVPCLCLEETLDLVRSLIQDDQAYLRFRRDQFVAYVSAHCSGNALRDDLHG
ncbi:MAG: hypothetical protein RIR18_719 [Pseudomonadota bacterium]